MNGSLVATHPRLEPLLDAAAASQRARLLEGMTQAVYEKGYAAATVADAVRLARVSRGTFYSLFASKEECFLEAYRHGSDVLFDRVAGAARDAPGDWRDRLRAGLRAYLHTLAGEPRFARSYLFEIQAAGAPAQAEHDAALRRFAARYRSSFEAAVRERPGLSMPSEEALFMLAAGVDRIVCVRLRERAFDRLPELEDLLMDFALALLEGWTAVHEPGGRRWT
jgi:AcrR family transcriptional regulator